MGIHVIWDNDEHTIIRFIYEGQWTWTDFHQAVSEANAMMDTVSHPVISIIDMSHTKYLPLNAMRHIRHVVNESRHHNNCNISIFLQASLFMKSVIVAAQRAYKDVRSLSEFFYVETLEDARDLAQKQIRHFMHIDVLDTNPLF